MMTIRPTGRAEWGAFSRPHCSPPPRQQWPVEGAQCGESCSIAPKNPDETSSS